MLRNTALLAAMAAFCIVGCSSSGGGGGKTADTSSSTGGDNTSDGADGADGTADATDGADGATDATDGATDATDGATDATDGATDATDGATDATDGATDATDGATDATDGATDATDGATDATDGTTPECDEGAFKCEDTAVLMECTGGQWKLKHKCPPPSVCDAAAGTCAVATCPAEGTGPNLGDQAKDLNFKLDAGGDYKLHALCGQGEATMIMLTASWCGACAQFAPTLQAWAETFTPFGGNFLVVVGEDKAGQPATAQVALSYRAEHGYNDNFVVVADPGFANVGSNINIGQQLGLPYLIVLGKDMTLEHIQGSDGNPGQALQKLSELTGHTIEPTCAGACGGAALAGCYCDGECAQYGDCCPDACDQCGVDCE